MIEETLFLDLNKYEKKSKIGQGSFGKVYKVLYKSTEQIYAAKISRDEIDENKKSDIMNIKREINIMVQISHPSILKFIGYSPTDFKEKPRPVIITEYSPNGTLSDILKLEKQSLSPDLWDDTRKLINIFGIASAMKYLHSNGIIHRDLKPDNILEDNYLFPKIADFGLSKNYHQNNESISYQSTKNFKGTPKYASPEMLNNNEYTKACDVYAFSIIVYEIITLEEPFKNFTYMMLLNRVVLNDYRPKFINPIPDCYRQLIESCWVKNPEERPTFDQIVEHLKNNKDFITDTVDKDEYLDYIDFIENSDVLFDPSKKFKKITFSKEQLNSEQIQKTSKNKKHKKINNDFKIEKIPGINIFHHSEFEIKKIIGKGKNGFVSMSIEKKNGTKIAFKELYPDVNKEEEERTYREIEIMSQLNHISIQKVYGYIKRNKKKFTLSVVLSLFEENGSLNNFIIRNPPELDFTQKYIIMYGIAAGMHYLHYNEIIHFDLKPKSILLNNKMEPIISDFHFAQREFEILHIEKDLLMTNDIAYIAPELLKTFENSLLDNSDMKSIDVYAFAFVLMFIYSGETPWNNTQPICILDKIKNEEKPNFPSNFPEIIRFLIKQCWNSDPKLRPSFELILYILESSIFMNNLEQKIDLKRFNEYKNKITFKNLFLNNDNYDIILINGVLFPKIVFEPIIDPIIHQINVFDRNDSFFKSYEVKSKFIFCEYYSVIMIKEEYSNNTNILSCFSSQIKVMLECEHPTLSTIYGNCNNKYLQNSSDNKNTIFDYFWKIDSLPVLAIDSFYGNKCIIDKIHLLSNSDIFNILYGIAAGMYYLHKRGFVLLNLKPVNIALNTNNKPIIFIDISARSSSDLIDKLSDIFKVFSNPYTAPELLDLKKFNNNNYDLKKCDVYSFAMIACYLLTKNPLLKLGNKECPVVDENIPHPFDILIKSCLNEDPLKRLSFNKILKMMGSQEFINQYHDLDIKSFQKYQKTVVDEKFIYTLVNNNLSRTNNEFRILNKIGNGKFGCVRLACDKREKSLYAYNEYKIDEKLFKRMVQILTKINYPSIIQLHGIIEPVKEFDVFALITPYAQNIDLKCNINKKNLNYTQKCIILYGIAMGIYELHSHGIIHRNLNASNILINEFFEPWISGFSLAKFIDPDRPLLQSITCETPIYMAPEILIDDEELAELGYDGKIADVFSFGMIAYYLMTGIIPFYNTKNMFAIIERISSGKRPEFPQNIENQFVDLISKCWKQTPEERATIAEICKTLSNPDFYISSTNHFNKGKFEKYQKKFGKIEFANYKIIEDE